MTAPDEISKSWVRGLGGAKVRSLGEKPTDDDGLFHRVEAADLDDLVLLGDVGEAAGQLSLELAQQLVLVPEDLDVDVPGQALDDLLLPGPPLLAPQDLGQVLVHVEGHRQRLVVAEPLGQTGVGLRVRHHLEAHNLGTRPVD